MIICMSPWPNFSASSRAACHDSRRRILEAAGRQALGDRDAENGGADHDQQRDRDDAPRRGDGESSDPV